MFDNFNQLSYMSLCMKNPFFFYFLTNPPPPIYKNKILFCCLMDIVCIFLKVHKIKMIWMNSTQFKKYEA